MRVAPLLLSLLVVSPPWGCDSMVTPTRLCSIDEGEPLPESWRGAAAIVVHREGDTVRVRGFSGAVPALADVVAEAGDVSVRVAADEEGRFDLAVPGQHDGVELSSPANGNRLRFRTRETDEALACVRGQPVSVGTTPNDVEFAGCHAGPQAITISSGDGAIEFPAPEGESGPPSVIFPLDQQGRGPIPWSAAVQPDGPLVAVSLFGQDEVALVNGCDASPLGTFAPRQPDGSAVTVAVSPSIYPPRPTDIDDDGVPDELITEMSLRAPEGVAFSTERLFVTYTNLIDTGPPALLGPGVLASFLVVGNELRFEGIVTLPFQNPQAVVTDEAGAAWVSCSGALERGGKGFSAASPGGLVRVLPESLSVAQVIELNDFAPGTPALVGDYVVVGSLLSARVLRIPRDASDTSRAVEFSLGTAGLESVFEVRGLIGGLALITEFGTDALHVLDVVAGQLDPWPFVDPIVLRPDDGLPRGLQAIAVHPAANPGVPAAAALLGLSSEWIPLRFDEVLGP